MARSIFLDIGVQWDELSSKDQRTCNYVMRYVRKLPFGVPRGVKATELTALGGTVKEFYGEVKRNESSVLAYKGGHHERDLLANYTIPAVNLENFNCPKACELFSDLIWLETCGNHTVNEAYHHCPKVEVKAYAQWMDGELC